MARISLRIKAEVFPLEDLIFFSIVDEKVHSFRDNPNFLFVKRRDRIQKGAKY